MQGQSPVWTEWSVARKPEAPVAKPSKKATLQPLMTGVLLTAGTLCAAGTFTWMLPVAGRSAQAPTVVVEPVTSLTPAPAIAAAPKGESAPLLPRAVLAAATAAAKSLAAVERSLDARAAMVADIATAIDTPANSNAFPVPPEATAPRTASAPRVTKAAIDAPAIHTPLPTPSVNTAATAGPVGERVVYLVDASGSLLDSLPQVIDWLGESLDGLDRNQQFTVLFFRQGEVVETPPMGLKQASFATKANVFGWMNPDSGNVLPQGKSDVKGALKAALAYGATDIVILSDDSLARRSDASADDAGVLADVARVVDAESGVRIHTAQFFYRDEAGALEAIADCFHGSYEFVKPAQRDTTATVDPLLDLAL